MGRDDLLPYPLAGAGAPAEQPGVVEEPARRARPRRTVPALLLLVAVLVLALVWTVGQWQRERSALADIRPRLDEAIAARDRAEAAAQDAVSDPLTVGQAFSSEMTVASSAVGRFIEEVDRSPAAARPDVFVAAFFGQPRESTGWTSVPGRSRISGVLASPDDAREPSLVWVSRRSSETIDPTVPSKEFCLQLDVGALVASAAAGRPWGRGADTAPLRWWSDTYAYVGEDECGPPQG